MTRLLAISIAAFALTFSACEKHPIAGETLVTETHGSDGPEAGKNHGHEAEGAAHAEKADHKSEKGGTAEETKH